jgi:hypothetical protein
MKRRNKDVSIGSKYLDDPRSNIRQLVVLVWHRFKLWSAVSAHAQFRSMRESIETRFAKRTGRLALPLFSGLLITACAGQGASIASKAKTSLIGKTKEQVLACMGAPPQRASSGKTEAWSYPSGGDTTTVGFAGTSYTMRRYCIVNIVMSADRVTGVNYTGRTGGLGAQCAFALKNCVP